MIQKFLVKERYFYHSRTKALLLFKVSNCDTILWEKGSVVGWF